MGKEPLSRKEWLLVLVTLIVFIVILSAAGIFFRHQSEKTADEFDRMTIVEGRIPTAAERQEGPAEPAVTLDASTFFIKPTAEELLAALREAGPFVADAPIGHEQPAQVIWPGYFFSLQETGTDAVVHLDIDESGFGTILRCLVDLNRYPELRTLEQGRKIWVAGRITGVDLAGDGIITIAVQHIRFTDDPPLPPSGR